MPEDSRQFLLAKISSEIRRKGRITYRELLEILLYEPTHGFYTRYLQIGDGPEFHFSTRPIELSPFYGRAFAKRIKELIGSTGLGSQNLNLVALGDGDGTLFGDVARELKKHREIERRLKKTSIELVPRFAAGQARRLEPLGVRVINDSAVNLDRHIDPGSGIFFAHEFLDQLPINRVLNTGNIILERYITLRGSRFVEVNGPLSSPELEEYFQITRPLRSGQSCAVIIDAMRLIKKLSAIIKQGIIIIIDYNVERGGLHDIAHSRFGRGVPLQPETLTNAIGKDITTDVDFEALKLIAGHFGFETIFEASDGDFLKAHLLSILHDRLGPPMKVLVLEKR
ncbi:MAG: SAM-dependent methyltransferase [Candidatus Margulisbacteria bacterium]|nr:SAM-dependent methyltransferase [Candidatus Margulisiibacteriota bacterium]